MMKLTQIKFFVFTLLSITTISCAQQKTKQLKPNILFILSEDMSIDLECYGMEAVKTPVLNNLAATGIQYMNAYGNNSIVPLVDQI